MELLVRSRDEFGQTIIVVTHDPRAASYADRVVFLRDGNIADQLSRPESMTQADFRSSIIDKMDQLEA
jgi:putative ABC transport system ATP-binding protein